MKNIMRRRQMLVAGILILAAILRLVLLGMKPPHFDEGVNGWFIDEMTKSGYYHYDPENYHGPFHFYLLFLFHTLMGRTVWALRLPVVAFSMLAVWWMTKFDRFFGNRTCLIAALGMAVSPAMIFYGRYAIHESELLFFLILMTWGIAGLWKFGEKKYLWSLGMGLTGSILTMETYFIHVACFLLAWPTLRLLEMIFRSSPQPFAEQKWRNRDLVAVTGVSALLVLFFYSGGFLDPMLRETEPVLIKGINRAVELPAFITNTFIRPYAAWFETGTKDGGGHVKSSYDLLLWHYNRGPQKIAVAIVNYYWIALIVRHEWITLAGLLGVIRLLWPNTGRQIRYLGIYGVGAVVAYSLVPYKTPWCIISIIWPFYLVFGTIIEDLCRLGTNAMDVFEPREQSPENAGNDASPSPPGIIQPESATVAEPTAIRFGPVCSKALATLLVAALCTASILPAIRLNFFHCTDENEDYVYVQTLPDLYKLTDPLFKLTAEDPTCYHLAGTILLSSYHPLPWVLGDFTAIGYYSDDKVPPEMDADFLLVEDTRINQVEKGLKHAYFTEPLKLRSAQETSKLYLSREKFGNLFPGRTPEFDPHHE